MTVPTAGDRTSVADSGAPPATNGDTVTTHSEGQTVVKRTGKRYDGTPREDPTIVGDGFGHLAPESDSMSPTSPPSGEPSRPLMRRYRQPKNIREFVAQANMVANRILNGEIDLDTARAYSAVARTMAQAITAQTVHARFLKTAPEMDFVDMEEPE